MGILMIDGVEFQDGPCGQCGAVASEADATTALAEWTVHFGGRPVCAACGDPIKMLKVILNHRHKRGHGSTTWAVMLAFFVDCLNLTAVDGTHVRIHGSCAMQALPHADLQGALRAHAAGVFGVAGEAEEIDYTRHDRGPEWRPWPMIPQP